MTKRILLLFFLMLSLTACGEETSSVYIQKMDEDEISQPYNPLASYSCGLLHYDGSMYTSSLSYCATDKTGLNWDLILGEELETVSGNHGVFWSTDGSELSEVTYEGTIYQVKGYEESFRVAVCYETAMPLADTCYYLVVFDRLNDIRLERGEELFEERLHLSDAVRVEGGLYGETVLYSLSEDTAAEEFLAELYDGILLDASESTCPALDPAQSYVLIFYDSAGLITELMVYEDGYVSIEYCGSQILVFETDAEKCKNLIAVIQQKTENVFMDGKSVKTELSLDSSDSGLNTPVTLEEYSPDTVEEIFVYINAGNKSETSYTVLKDNTESFNNILKMFWNSNHTFSATESGYDKYGYNFYITLKCADETDNLTIFVFDTSVIRINGVFYRSAEALDFAPVNDL